MGLFATLFSMLAGSKSGSTNGKYYDIDTEDPDLTTGDYGSEPVKIFDNRVEWSDPTRPRPVLATTSLDLRTANVPIEIKTADGLRGVVIPEGGDLEEYERSRTGK